MKCGYRIYPAWRGFHGHDPKMVTTQMANRAGAEMGRYVVSVEKVGHGYNQRSGWFEDYDVTYSSTAPTYEELKR